jgi:hypothetical protein
MVEVLLKRTVADPKLDSAAIELLGKTAATSAEGKLLLLQVVLYHPNPALAEQTVPFLTAGFPEIGTWLTAERDTLRHVRSGSDFRNDSGLATTMRALIDEMNELARKRIPALQTKIGEQAKTIEQLESVRAELTRRQEEIESAQQQLDDARAKEIALSNRIHFDGSSKAVLQNGYGSPQGTRHDDLIPEGARIVAIGCRYGNRINSIWLVYEKAGVIAETPRRGGQGGQEQTIFLDEDEFITSFIHRGTRAEMAYLEVETNHRKLTLGKSDRRIREGPLPLVIKPDSAPQQGNKGLGVCVGMATRADKEVRCIAPFIQYKD